MSELRVELWRTRTEVDIQKPMGFTGCDFVQSHYRLHRIYGCDLFQHTQELLLISHAAYANGLGVDTNHGRERCVLLNAADRTETEVPTPNKKSREHILELIVHNAGVVRQVVEDSKHRIKLRVPLFLLQCLRQLALVGNDLLQSIGIKLFKEAFFIVSHAQVHPNILFDGPPRGINICRR